MFAALDSYKAVNVLLKAIQDVSLVPALDLAYFAN